MHVVVGSDDDVAVVEVVCRCIERSGHVVRRVGIGSHWSDVGRLVGREVISHRADVGVVLCWTGTGVSIAANKVPGIRAALCTDAITASGARQWNDANVLALSIRLTTDALAEEILDAFLSTGPDPDQIDRIAMIESSPS